MGSPKLTNPRDNQSMSKLIVDRTGITYGNLVALHDTGKWAGDGSVVWLCQCSCSNLKEVSGNRLQTGDTKSCGCLVAETRKLNAAKCHARIIANNIQTGRVTHGHTKKGQTPTYRSWRTMVRRAGNRDGNHPAYTFVAVCDRWKDSFENFLTDRGERPEGTTLGRNFDTGNYEPGNCCWQTRAEQGDERLHKRLLKKLASDCPELTPEIEMLCQYGKRTESPAIPSLVRITLARRPKPI